jgi:hypothetical protein
MAVKIATVPRDDNNNVGLLPTLSAMRLIGSPEMNEDNENTRINQLVRFGR